MIYSDNLEKAKKELQEETEKTLTRLNNIPEELIAEKSYTILFNVGDTTISLIKDINNYNELVEELKNLHKKGFKLKLDHYWIPFKDRLCVAYKDTKAERRIRFDILDRTEIEKILDKVSNGKCEIVKQEFEDYTIKCNL